MGKCARGVVERPGRTFAELIGPSGYASPAERSCSARVLSRGGLLMDRIAKEIRTCGRFLVSMLLGH